MRPISLLILLGWLAVGTTGQAAGYRLTVDGKPVGVSAFTHYHYAAFDQSQSVRLELTCPMPVTRCEISPHSRKISCRAEGNRISFSLDRPGYVMVRINDTEKFFVFTDVPEQFPADTVSIVHYGVRAGDPKPQTALIQQAMDDAARSGKTLLFPKGSYIAGQLRPGSHTRIHLARGAILQSDTGSVAQYSSDDRIKTKKFIYIKDTEGVKISGYGTICGNGARLRERFGDEARMRLIMAVNSQQLTIEGVTLQDPGSWNTQLLLCREVKISHVKLMNDTELSNTDGFDPDASQNVLIEQCFAYCSDDNVAVKSTNYGDYLADVDGITVRGCLFLTKKSSLKVGTETRATSMRNILFEHNDVVECDRGMALYVSDGAVLENIRYLGNRFERNYPDAKRAGLFFQVNRRNADSRAGQIKKVEIRDCVFDTVFPKPSEMLGLEAGHGIDSVVIGNLTIGGKKVHSLQEAGIKTNEFVGNVTFVDR